jgi:hypothetical protein
MLHGVTTFVGSNCSSGYTVTIIHILTQVHRMISRIVMVGKMSGCRNHLYIIYTIIPQHLFGYILTCHSIWQSHFGIGLEFTFQTMGNQPAQQSKTNKYNPIHVNSILCF